MQSRSADARQSQLRCVYIWCLCEQFGRHCEPFILINCNRSWDDEMHNCSTRNYRESLKWQTSNAWFLYYWFFCLASECCANQSSRSHELQAKVDVCDYIGSVESQYLFSLFFVAEILFIKFALNSDELSMNDWVSHITHLDIWVYEHWLITLLVK